MKKSYLLILIILILSVKQVSAQMTARVVADSLFMPWELVYAPDNHIWFTQKNGYVCRLEPVSGRAWPAGGASGHIAARARQRA